MAVESAVVESSPNATFESSRLRSVFWASWLGLMFDGFDATICVLALFPALQDLLGTSSHSLVGHFGGIVLASFIAGWGAGAIIFGALCDRLGRVNSMLITILVYALFTGLCATSHNWMELAAYRFLVGCGIGGEQTAGIVLIAESFRGKQRIEATGRLITGFGCGYILAGLVNLWLGPMGWRYMFVAGMIPALLTLYLRLAVRESLVYTTVQKDRQFDKPCSPLRIFSPAMRGRTATVAVLSTTCIVGYWAIMSWLPPWINQLTGTPAVAERSTVTFCMNVGSIISGLLTARFVRNLSRKGTFRFAFLGAMFSYIIMFTTAHSVNFYLYCCALAAGFYTQLPFQLCFIYAPELFSTQIRGAALGFSVQVGRLFAALLALFGGEIIASTNGSYSTACCILALIYLFGLGATFFLPASTGDIPEAIPRRVE
jgi:MFS family permease